MEDKRRESGSYIWSFHIETPSERKLSATMSKAGIKFGREVPVKGFTVDFLIDSWLVIEVDGESHLVKGRAEKDASRQKVIEDSGFTVMRIPAAELSTESGLKRWVRRIEQKIAEGPPYLNQGRSLNQDYLRQLEEAREALRIGEEERRKREAPAFGDSRRSGRPDSFREASGESMEDYFGSTAEDFEALLERYDWSNTSAWTKGEARPVRPQGADRGRRQRPDGRRRRR